MTTTATTETTQPFDTMCDLTKYLDQPWPGWANELVREQIHYRCGRLDAITRIISEHPDLLPAEVINLEIEAAHTLMRHLRTMHERATTMPMLEACNHSTADWLGFND
jgi:hypothetical protein